MHFILFFVLMYWLPTIIAIVRRVPSVAGIAILNFFGFLVVTWWMALVWSLASRTYERVVIIENGRVVR